MEDILRSISSDYKIPFEELWDKYGSRLEDMDTVNRCKARNKNGKQCCKLKKEGGQYCAIHSHPEKSTADGDFIFTEAIEKRAKEREERSSVKKEKEKSSLLILETDKKKGLFPVKVKKITYEGKPYYMNKNSWVYEMNPETEMIGNDTPIGKLIDGRLMVIHIS